MNIPLPSPWLNLLTALIALAPAALTAWWGRALVRMADDPAIAERLAAHRKRVLLALVVTGTVLAVTRPHCLSWTLPLLLVSRAVAAFPTRRILLGETWTLPQYLIGILRFYLASLGFWILLGIGPLLVRGNHWWVIGAVTATLLAWNHWFSAVLLRLLRARPLISESLAPRFAQVVGRSKIPHPRVWRAGPPGAVVANAVALPSLRGSSVLLSETLLSRLSDEETTAIFAHEAAHLEHHDPARLRRMYLGTLLVISAGMALVPVARTAAPQLLGMLVNIWPVVVLVCLVIRVRRAQENEYASDRRAAELCEDHEALANALIKLHTIGRVPRRWELKLEQSASHPSLARRLQAIRAAGRASPAAIEGSEIFRASGPGVFIAFDLDALRHYQGVAPDSTATIESLRASARSVTAIRFSDIVELRVAARGDEAPELLVVERSGERRLVQLRAEDLSRLQGTLDGVDALLSAAPRGPLGGPQLGSIAAVIAAIAALIGAELWSVVIVALLAAWHPTARLLLAAAAASVAATALVLSRQMPGVEHSLILVAGVLPLVALGLGMLIRLARESGSADKPIPAWLLWCLSLMALAALALPLVAAQGGLLRLTQTSRMATGATVLPLAAAVVLAQARANRSRRLAAVFGIAACMPLLLGTTWFRERVVQDPLLATLPDFTVTEASVRQVARFEVGPWASRLRLSPQGRHIGVSGGGADTEDEDSPEFSVCATDGGRRRLKAIDLQFIDEFRTAVLSTAPGGLKVELFELDRSKAALWRVVLAGLGTGRLAVGSGTGRWRVLGETRDGTLRRFEGFVGEDAVTQTEWVPPATEGNWSLQGVAGSGPAALWLHQRYGILSYGWTANLMASLGGGWPVKSSLFAGSLSGASLLARSEAQVTCLDPPVGEDEPVCFASDGTRTNVFTVDIPAGHRREIAAIQGSLWASSLHSAGVVAASWNGAPSLLHLNERRLVRILPHNAVTSWAAAYSADMVGVVSPQAQQSTVTVYRLEKELQTRHRQ